MSNDMTIIEINGIKMQVDMRHAKRIDQYKIGSNVKILIKDYGDSYKSYYGSIVGFDAFENLPTIIICYIKVEYNSAEVKFIHFNAKTKDVEICAMSDSDKLIDQVAAIEQLDREILKSESNTVDLKAKKEYFLKHYNMHFNDFNSPLLINK